MSDFILKNSFKVEFILPNALALAKAASLVYQPKDAIENTLINDWKFQNCRFYDWADTQAFVATTDSYMALS